MNTPCGSLGLIENVVPPGHSDPPLHAHPGFDEGHYLLDGELEFRAGPATATVRAALKTGAPGA